MNFNNDRPIYRQIIDYAFACILSDQWLPEAKVPSVRELAVQMAVNTHTVLKAFEFLQAHDIIYPRRGMGYFLASDAKSRVDATRREEFFSTTLPALFREMNMLGISIDDVTERYRSQIVIDIEPNF
ncbi:MAG: GntR family transcriptional regulator [Muribaculaceae bacterium]|nr:GntR family transcriptional regulator [Muribaculaceae bacterium]